MRAFLLSLAAFLGFALASSPYRGMDNLQPFPQLFVNSGINLQDIIANITGGGDSWAFQAWNWIGEKLRKACGYVNGEPFRWVDLGPVEVMGKRITLRIPLYPSRPAPEYGFLCELSSTWSVIDGLLKEDLVEFMADVINSNVNDLLSLGARAIWYVEGENGSFAGTLGDPVKWADAIANFRDNLRGSYRQLRREARNLAWNSLKDKVEEMRRRFLEGQRMGSFSMPSSPTNPLKEAKAFLMEFSFPEMGTVYDTSVGLRNLDIATKAANISGGSGKIGTALSNAVEEVKKVEEDLKGRKDNRFGSGIDQKGAIEETLEKVRQAPDTRTAVEASTEMLAHLVNLQLFNTRSLVLGLNAIIKNGVYTNQALAELVKAQGLEASNLEDQFLQEIEEESVELVAMLNTNEAFGSATKRLFEESLVESEPVGAGF